MKLSMGCVERETAIHSLRNTAEGFYKLMGEDGSAISI